MRTLEELGEEVKELLESGETLIVPISYIPETHIGDAIARGFYSILGKVVEVEKHYDLRSMMNDEILGDLIDDLRKVVSPYVVESGKSRNQRINVTVKAQG